MSAEQLGSRIVEDSCLMQRTLLLVNHQVDVGVETDDDGVRRNVHPADDVQDVGVLHGNLLRDLHHHEDDYQVGTARALSVKLRAWGAGVRTFEG